MIRQLWTWLRWVVFSDTPDRLHHAMGVFDKGPAPVYDFRQPNARHGLCGHDGSGDA